MPPANPSLSTTLPSPSRVSRHWILRHRPGGSADFYLPLHDTVLKLNGGANRAESYLEPNYYWLEMAARLLRM